MKGADRVVTTEKDMLKLRILGVGHLPVRALRIEMKIREDEELFRRIMQLFPEREERSG
jgi:tetraacyldisaccharide-1-P 4'-kinase